jgi:hypothetical protein
VSFMMLSFRYIWVCPSADVLTDDDRGR